jgi:hypothetical protein
VVLLLFATAGLAQPRDSDRAEPPPEPVGPDYVPSWYYGKVVGITDKAVTIKLEGDVKLDPIEGLPGGIQKKWVYVQDNTQPPLEFIFADNLFPGRRGPKTPRCSEHQVADLRVGDVIELRRQRMRGGDYCIGIQIQRRPGGKVPPAIGDAKAQPEHRVDNRMNTEQYLEETLIPAYRDLKLFPVR